LNQSQEPAGGRELDEHPIAQDRFARTKADELCYWRDLRIWALLRAVVVDAVVAVVAVVATAVVPAPAPLLLLLPLLPLFRSDN
jgi:anti-sigma-K factor RskA